jgi:shikimate kinase
MLLTSDCYCRYPLWVDRESVVLIGMAGAGKSTIGLPLSRALNFGFTDLDIYIQEKDHQTIQGIIDTRGEEALLQLEEKRLYEIDLKRRVVAPGGSIVYVPRLMEYLKQHSVLVYIDEAYDRVEKRLKNAVTRGIVGFKSKSLKEIYDERRPLYSRYADITVDPEGKLPEQVVKEILEMIYGRR